MRNLIPSARERQFLRGIAAVNPHFRPQDDEPGVWWSAYDLQHTMLFSDFRLAITMSLAGIGRSCERKGFARTRRVGTPNHGWSEYRITSYGRGLVADSCIGGGLPWRTGDGAGPDVRVECPACRADYRELNLPRPVREPVQAGWRGEIPAHPLPGYLPEPATTATEETR